MRKANFKFVTQTSAVVVADALGEKHNARLLLVYVNRAFETSHPTSMLSKVQLLGQDVRTDAASWFL